MKFQWQWDPQDSSKAWFLRRPIDGPSYVALSRINEAITRVLKGEKNWHRFGGNSGYRCLYDDGSER